MKSIKYFVGASLVSLASIGLFVACGDDPEETVDGCVLDTDCTVEGEVCEGEVCVPTCMDTSECAEGEICSERMNGDGMVCAPDESTTCNDEEDPNVFCEGELGAGAFCDTASGECVLPEPEVFVAQITDTTTVADACESSTDPGSDIQGIELQDDMGNTLGWGNLVANGVIEEGNEQLNYGVVSGDAPSLDGSGCVETFDGNVLSLGCTGYVAVQFEDDMDNPVPLADGQTIVVYEYGGVCSTGTTDDSWAVFTCDDTDAVNTGDVTSCTNGLGNGSGVGNVTVQLAE